MKNRLYYVVEADVEDVGNDNFILTGNKNVTVYEMVRSTLQQFASIDLELSDNSEEAIQKNLIENDNNIEDFEFVRL